MRLCLETTLPCRFEQAVGEVRTPRLLMHIAAPMIRFEPADGTEIPGVWEEKTYWFKLKILGFIPFGKQAVRITCHEDANRFRIRDNGYSRLIRRWDHWITIEKSDGRTVYRDTLDLDAGILTPLVWVFARIFYGHRQKRWLKLAESGFNYEPG